jgi:hypothetical protein
MASGATFHLEEYKSLRTEIAADDADIRRLERLCATGCAVVWVWLFGRPREIWSVVALVPTLIAIFGWARTSALYKGMLDIAEYVRQIEKQFAQPPLVGWETYLHPKRQGRASSELTMMRSSHAFWALLTGVTVVFALAYLFIPT